MDRTWEHLIDNTKQAEVALRRLADAGASGGLRPYYCSFVVVENGKVIDRKDFPKPPRLSTQHTRPSGSILLVDADEDGSPMSFDADGRPDGLYGLPLLSPMPTAIAENVPRAIAALIVP